MGVPYPPPRMRPGQELAQYAEDIYRWLLANQPRPQLQFMGGGAASAGRKLGFLCEVTAADTITVRAGRSQVLGAAHADWAETTFAETTNGTYYLFAEYTYGTGWTTTGSHVVQKATTLPTEDSTKRVILIQKFVVAASVITGPLEPQDHVGTLFVIDWENCG
jgi:hypothetical protein